MTPERAMRVSALFAELAGLLAEEVGSGGRGLTSRLDGPTVGERIRNLRKVAWIGALDLDRLAGLSEGHTSVIETRRNRGLRDRTATAVAQVFGVSTAWLLRGEGDPPTEAQVLAAVARAKAAAV